MTEKIKERIYKFPDLDVDIFDNEFDIKESKFINEPKISLGFHYYLNQSKEKMEILNDEKFKDKDFYLVVNSFEHKIKNNDNDIESFTHKKFNIKSENKKILSRAFYKLWEILTIFDLIPINNSIVSAHLAEGPGSFVQSLIYFRDNTSKKSDSDKYCAITLNSKEKNIPAIKKKNLECLSKKDSQRFFMHKTDKNDNGDLTNLKIINNFKDEIKVKVDFVTADGGINWIDENNQEQESYKLILGEILACLKIQKDGGSFVLKIFDIFTDITIKYLCILKTFYSDVYIFKPFTSRLSNSEKYIICKNFNSNNLDTKIKKLEILLESIDSNNNLVDIISEFSINQKIYNFIKELNNYFSNKQFIEINKIINFINSKDYFGDKYHEYLNNQIESSNYWNKIFYESKFKLFI